MFKDPKVDICGVCIEFDSFIWLKRWRQKENHCMDMLFKFTLLHQYQVNRFKYLLNRHTSKKITTRFSLSNFLEHLQLSSSLPAKKELHASTAPAKHATTESYCHCRTGYLTCNQSDRVLVWCCIIFVLLGGDVWIRMHMWIWLWYVGGCQNSVTGCKWLNNLCILMKRTLFTFTSRCYSV